MEIIVKRIIWDDWEAIYINDSLALESSRKIPIELILESIQSLMNETNMCITKIESKKYSIYSDDDVIFPKNFNDISKEIFE